MITIRWERSPRIPNLRHGFVGEVRAFTIELRAYGCELEVGLPGPTGTRPSETCSSEVAAEQRANSLLAEFLAQLNTPART